MSFTFALNFDRTTHSLVLPPVLYRGAVCQDRADRCDLVGKVFLKAAASGSWA